jgi:hypothetical protein
MKYGSVSKLKNSANTSINKGTIKPKNTIEKEKNPSSYRQGSLIITATKFKTSKNSRKYRLTFSCEGESSGRTQFLRRTRQ